MSKNLLTLLLAVASFAVYYLAVGPIYNGTGGVWQPSASIQSLKVLNKQYDETLSQADTLLGQADQLRAQYMGLTEEQKSVMKIMVPDSIDKVRLLSEVSNVLLKSGFAPNDLSFADGVSSSSRGASAISFSVRTTYPKFKELMDDFEKSMRLFSVQSISFSSDKESDISTYQVKLETYFIK